jgi:hypothetical protein
MNAMDFGKLLWKIAGVAKDYIENSQKNEEPVQMRRPEQRPAATTIEREKTPAEWEAYFKEILLNEFSSYTIRENVPVTDLVGFAADECQLYTTRPSQVYKAEWGQPFTFVLETDGKPKGVVMLGSGHCHDEKVKYLIARMYAEKLDIPYINFYTQMPNERSYVISRIRKYMG